MKKMIAFIFVIFLFLGIAVAKINFPQKFDYERLIIVSEKKLDYASIKNGNDYYYFFDKKDKTIFNKNFDITDIKGLTFYISSKYDLNYFSNHFNYLTSKSEVDKKQVYYGYDKNYYDFRLIDGKKINFQLVKDEEGWILGYPAILTSF